MNLSNRLTGAELNQKSRENGFTTPSEAKSTPVLGIDWLQLNCHIDRSEYKWMDIYEERELPYQTPMFSKVSELYFKGHKRICTITYRPKTPQMHPNMHLIKFDNWVLYANDLHTFIPEFLSENNITFKNITQIDVCGDFINFANNRKPENLIKYYLSGKYAKIGRGGYSSIGTHSTNGKNKYHVTHDYLRFGSGTSSLLTRLYNKSKEQREKTYKPWIREKWESSKLLQHQPKEAQRIHPLGTPQLDIWRLEFSIKSSRVGTLDTDTGELTLTDLSILNPDNYTALYKALVKKYFSFVQYDASQTRKDRMKPLHLFDDFETHLKAMQYLNKLETNRSHKIYCKKLQKENDLLRKFGKIEEAKKVSEVLKTTLVHHDLLEWALHQVEFADINNQLIDYSHNDLELIE